MCALLQLFESLAGRCSQSELGRGCHICSYTYLGSPRQICTNIVFRFNPAGIQWVAELECFLLEAVLECFLLEAVLLLVNHLPRRHHSRETSAGHQPLSCRLFSNLRHVADQCVDSQGVGLVGENVLERL